MTIPRFRCLYLCTLPSTLVDCLCLLSYLLLIAPVLLVDPRQCRQPMLLGLRIHPNCTTIPPYLRLLMFDIRQRPLTRNSVFVSENEDVRVLAEEAVNVFEGSVRCFWIEEVDDWHERGVEEGPNYVEFPVQRLDTDGGDLDDCFGWSVLVLKREMFVSYP